MPSLDLIIPTNSGSRDRLVVDYFSTATADVPSEVRNDSNLEISIQPVVENSPDATDLYSPDFEDTDTFQYGVGLADSPATGGTFQLEVFSANITSSSVAATTTITTATNHNLVTGNTVWISGHTGSTPAIAGAYTATVTGVGTFTIPVNVSVGGTGGKVYLTKNTTALAYSITAANLQTALSANIVQMGYAACTVTEISDTIFQVVGNSNGAIPADFVIGDGSYLTPSASCFVNGAYLGTTVTPYKFLIEIKLSPFVFSEPATLLPAAGVTLATTQAGGSSSNRIQKITFDAPNTYGGTYSISAAAGARQVILSISVAAAAVVTTEENHNIPTGSTVVIAGSNSTPTIDGSRVVTVLTPTSFSVAVNTSVAGTVGTVAWTQTHSCGTGRPGMEADALAQVLTGHPQIYFKNLSGFSNNVIVTKNGQDYFVEFTGTLGSSSVPSLTVTNIDLVAPRGVTGAVNYNTISLNEYAASQDGDSFDLTLQVRRTRASGEVGTILGPVTQTIFKDILDPMTMVPTPLPDYYTAAQIDAILVAKFSRGNLLYVDKVFGNDGTALTERDDLQYLTCAAAKADAVSGDTIFVRPGTYSENDLLKDGVNWFFMPGANVVYTGSTDKAVFDDSGGAVTCVIEGDVFSTNNAAGNLAEVVLFITNAASDITLRCNTIQSVHVGSTLSPVDHEDGTLRIDCDTIISAGLLTMIFWTNGQLEINANIIRAASWPVWSEVANGATVTGDMHINAFRIETTGNYAALTFNDDNANARIWVNAQVITGAYQALVVGKGAVTNGAKYYVTAQKITNNPTDAGAYATIYMQSGNLYLTVQKLTVPNRSSDCGILHFSTGTGYISADIGQMEFLGDCLNMVSIGHANQTWRLRIGECIGSATAGGVTISAGTLSIQNSYINTAANSSSNPITKSGGTLKLYSSTFVAEAGRDSIEAGTAQNVMAAGCWTNKAVDGNVTITVTGGLSVDADVA